MSPIFESPSFKDLLAKYSSVEYELRPQVVNLLADPSRWKERAHIESIFKELPQGKYKKGILRHLRSERPEDFYGAWYELMVYDWLKEQGKEPVLQPDLPSGSKPDFLIKSDDLNIYIDVTHVRESSGDKNISPGKEAWWPAATATFLTLQTSIEKKASQHKRGLNELTNAAYVICIGLETILIGADTVKTCFLGSEGYHIKTGRISFMKDSLLFENQVDGTFLVRHKHVSALLVAQHNRASVEEGYKLRFSLIENPYANTEIAGEEFGPIHRFVVISKTETNYNMQWIS